MIQLTMIVDDVDVYIGMGYNYIRIYTSTEETGTYTYLANVVIVGGVVRYSYTHTEGTSDTWYKSSMYKSGTGEECCWSDPVQGVCPSLYHFATYPPECVFEESDSVIIRKIRRLIGDLKTLGRLYVDGSDDYTMSTAIQLDNHTVNLGEKCWPVYVSVNSDEKTTLGNPIVQGYQYLTFSGTLDSSADTVDVWYYTFKFSDREIFESYGDTLIPPGLTSDTVTQDHIVLQAAVDLLENMTAEDMVDNGALVRDDQTVYDPSPGLRERDIAIKRLKDRLDKLVRQYMFGNLTGVLLD